MTGKKAVDEVGQLSKENLDDVVARLVIVSLRLGLDLHLGVTGLHLMLAVQGGVVGLAIIIVRAVGSGDGFDTGLATDVLARGPGLGGGLLLLGDGAAVVVVLLGVLLGVGGGGGGLGGGDLALLAGGLGGAGGGGVAPTHCRNEGVSCLSFVCN